MIHLYSEARCPFSHRVRVILYRKDMDFKIIDVNMHRQDLMTLNPYNETPVLVDDIDKNNRKKDLILVDTNIICEYIDERFPHPQLMPIEPTEKARLRMIVNHFDRELLHHVRFVHKHLNSKDKKKDVEQSRKIVTAGLDSVAAAFISNKKAEHLFANNFSLLDASVLPLLWRLDYYKIPSKAAWNDMHRYAKRSFQHPAFIASLTPAERGMNSI